MRRIFAVGFAAAALFGFVSVPAASAASPSETTQVIDYHGYQIQVPASWPVYDLTADPARCVRFDQHAVYLGTPGADQQCPTHAFGRTEAVLVAPESASVPPGTVTLGPDAAAFSGALPASSHTVHLTAPGPGVQITATYGADDASIRAILAGARMTARATQSAPAPSAPAPVGPDLSVRQGQGLGFDACTAPSVATMTDWLASPYRVIGTYLGGANWACDYGNFNRTWVSVVAAEGWQDIPIWVGPQAPCTTIKNATVIDPANAAAQGAGRSRERGRRGPEFRRRPGNADLLRHGGLRPVEHRMLAGGHHVSGRMDRGTARGRIPLRGLLERGVRHRRPRRAVRQPGLPAPGRHLAGPLELRPGADRPLPAQRRLAERRAAPVLRRP